MTDLELEQLAIIEKLKFVNILYIYKNYNNQ